MFGVDFNAGQKMREVKVHTLEVCHEDLVIAHYDFLDKKEIVEKQIQFFQHQLEELNAERLAPARLIDDLKGKLEESKNFRLSFGHTLEVCINELAKAQENLLLNTQEIEKEIRFFQLVLEETDGEIANNRALINCLKGQLVEAKKRLEG